MSDASDTLRRVARRCDRIARSPWFVNATTLAILLAAALMGVETDRALVAANKALFTVLNATVQALFVAEIGIRLLAYWPRPTRFFREGWNVFDFVVVAASLVPAAGPAATVIRLARVLRVVRLVSVSAELRLIVETMLRSVPSMGNVALLLGILMYVYSVLGVHLFGAMDPARWGDLGRSFLTCFQMLTLEGWVDVQAAVVDRAPMAPLFFGSYILIAVFVVVNLFIAVVLNNLENARASLNAASEGGGGDIRREIAALRAQLDRFERGLDAASSPGAGRPVKGRLPAGEDRHVQRELDQGEDAGSQSVA